MKKAGELLSAFFERSTYSMAREYADLFNSWKNIAGDALASHSRVRELDKTILLVEADHPGWIQLLQAKQSQLLEGVRRRFPELAITGIAIRLAKDAGLQRPVSRNQGAAPVLGSEAAIQEQSGQDSTALGSSTADPLDLIRDEEFRETLKRLERSIAARNASTQGEKPGR